MTDTRQALAAQREQFEAWCIQRWRGDRNALLRNLPDAEDHPDEYKMGPIEFAWQAYRAALAAQPVEGAVAQPARVWDEFGRTNSGDETGGTVQRFGFDISKPKPEIIPATCGAFVYYDDYLALHRKLSAQAAPAPEPSAQAVAHPSHQTVREWMPVSEALRLSDLWTAGDLDNCGQWRAAIKVLADEVRALAASPQPVAGAVAPEDAKVGDAVWFRMGRMYGTPPVTPVRAMVTAYHGGGVVDIEIGCEGMSQISGTANRVRWKGHLTGSQIHDGACWWHADLPGLRQQEDAPQAAPAPQPSAQAVESNTPEIDDGRRDELRSALHGGVSMGVRARDAVAGGGIPSLIDRLWASDEVMAINAELGLTIENLSKIARAVLAASPQPAPSAQGVPVAWRCFHCDEVFIDREAAQDHFGVSLFDQPACHIDIQHVRWLEAQHRRNCDDDTEALRTIRGLAGEHEALRRSAEEQGYARGLADARKHPEELGLAIASAPSTPPRAVVEAVPLTDEQADALRRLWPAIEKAMGCLVFTAEQAGAVQADMNTVRRGIAPKAAQEKT